MPKIKYFLLMKKSFFHLKTAPMGPFSLVCINIGANWSNLAPKLITSIKTGLWRQFQKFQKKSIFWWAPNFLRAKKHVFCHSMRLKCTKYRKYLSNIDIQLDTRPKKPFWNFPKMCFIWPTVWGTLRNLRSLAHCNFIQKEYYNLIESYFHSLKLPITPYNSL